MHMGKFGQRLLILSMLVCFAVFFGVDIATKGINETGGPVPAKQAVQADVSRVVTAQDLMAEVRPEPAADRTGKDNAKPAAAAQTAASRTVLDSPETAMEGLASVTGKVLRSTAQEGVKLFVSLIDGLLN